MEQASWHFNRMRPCDKARDPIQGEFFATDAISNPGEALVREGIQNSLDARRDNEQVRIRIRISGAHAGAPRNEIAPFLGGLDEHLRAPGNGLRDIPRERESCPFLVFEDFGTTGLSGDPREWKPALGSRNHFYHFFRAEGRSDKSDSDIGRWGVGKQVFPRASRINSIFGLTVRADDKKKMLMGMAVLKSHDVNGTRYGPDGWFGRPSETGDSSLILPIEDGAFIASFSRTFDSSRGSEPGLTIVVPWYDLDLTDENLVRAVLRGYFWPILRGQVKVLIETEKIKILLDALSLEGQIEKIGGELEKEILPLVELTKWSSTLSAADFLTLAAGPTWQWSRDLFPANALENIRGRYERGHRTAIRVPVTIHEKTKQPRQSYFDVFLVRDGSDHSGIPVFIREGIIIPDVRRRGTGVLRGVRSIVVAEDGPMAAFLGDSENPAHTQWQKDGAIFKGKYEDGAKILDFVIHSPLQIIRIISEQDKKEDTTLLSDLFSIPAPPEEQESRARGKRPGKPGMEPDKPTPPEPRPKPFIIDKISGGFVVRRGDTSVLSPGKTLLIRTAYQVRRGNPFKKYDTADFDLSRHMVTDVKGAAILEKRKNILRIKIDSNDFRVEVTGFDLKRDVRVEVRGQEDDNADSNAQLY